MRRRGIPLSALAVALVVATAGLGTAAQVPGGEAPATPRSQMDLVKQLLSAPDQAAPWATDVAREHLSAVGSAGDLLRATATGLHGMDPASLESIPPLSDGHDVLDLETLLTLAGASDPEQAATTLAEHPAAVQAAVATVLQATLEARPVIVEALAAADPVELATAALTAHEQITGPAPGVPTLEQLSASSLDPALQTPLASVDQVALVAAQAHIADAVDRAADLLASIPAPAPATPSHHPDRIDTDLGAIIVADGGPHIHDEEDALLLIDLGGDDVYKGRTASAEGPVFSILSALPSPPADDSAFEDWATELAVEVATGAEVRITLDVHGNDRYDQGPAPTRLDLGLGTQGFAVGGGVGILMDLGGDDVYDATALAQGFGSFGGAGVLVDATGDDRYSLGLYGQGAGLVVGTGLLADGEGRDEYHGGVVTQGVTLIAGAGVLVEGLGNDVYTCQVGDGPLFTRSNADETTCHGVGILGTGAVFDGQGDDRLTHEGIAGGVGGAGVGILVDLEGNDVRTGGPHAYGVGTLGVGILVDDEGHDTYTTLYTTENTGGTAGLTLSHGAASLGLGVLVDGAGHDTYAASSTKTGIRACAMGCALIGVALFHDAAGNDHYTTTVGQAAAFTGVAMMLDGAGDDTYLLAGSDQGQAYVPPPQTSFCSWALLADGAGSDDYSNPVTTAGTREDNSWWTRNEYALGVDGAGGVVGYALDGQATTDAITGSPYADCVDDVHAIVAELTAGQRSFLEDQCESLGSPATGPCKDVVDAVYDNSP